MHDFCTYFDTNYLSRALALYRSLQLHAGRFRLWALCMDDESYRSLQRLSLDNVYPIALQDLLRDDPALSAARENRSRVEFYFTCTPSLPLYIFRQCADAEIVTYVDADLYFYADPTPIYDEMGAASVLIIGHRFAERHKHLEDHGVYNVGLLAFRRNDEGKACLRRWREQCIEWCYDRLEDGRFADQKYLDEWPASYPGVHVLQHKGAGLAPWNIANYGITSRDGMVYVDDQRLIVYHFHGLKQSGRHTYQTGLHLYGAHAKGVTRSQLYRGYVRALMEGSRELAARVGVATAAGESMRWLEAPSGSLFTDGPSLPRWVKSRLRRILARPLTLVDRAGRVASGELLLVVGDVIW